LLLVVISGGFEKTSVDFSGFFRRKFFTQMSLVEALRESLAAFARTQNDFQPVYVNKDECCVSYNGSYYTVFLLRHQTPPTFADNPAILLCESANVNVWRIAYSFAAHCSRLKAKTAVVAAPAPCTVVQKILEQKKRQVSPWEILGVLRTSDPQQVNRAYRALSLRVHPDKNKDEGSAEAFKVVAHAYGLMTQ
jgi:hypothetical protein